ncbi:hypothetical protein AUJ42_03205 [Candidatus Collierbacteria bacterium CG1_02_44_10]|uniref:Uncharacterized protein n=2 Tax=Candidatus Collieribacteriota TaxID=1752725 RepID=A0A2M8BX79_9BACT|nr:MAG: hypothetical protein AUJ42_03205 [Candidatus Collierbacteria bacterium CG1_02_44_10]PIZ24839.1 MAG: hypothetical protein COY48_00835 [Candidatus Collierbacteria bacterium CG_4_10_14_0_8_um_filter_43_86]PJB48434.1 MAG: hypothetical protein CO104_01290 [Candidatus Collierbacteria bacterium CG_4_9_14_3_um_filter_43_16]
MLTQTDLDNIDKRTEKTIKKAISDNYFPTKDDFRESMSTLQITMDKVYGIVKKIDEEQTVVSHTVQNHENRITKLETTLA